MTFKNIQIDLYKTFARDWTFACSHHILHSRWSTSNIYLETPVGSPVSPILANLVMEDIENKAITEFHHRPWSLEKLCRR